MDYKYIEQLIERYFKAETSLEEEQILRSFFRQDNLPKELGKIASLFQYEDMERKTSLSEEFDSKIIDMISQEETVKARQVSLFYHLRPLLRAAALIAVIFTAVNVAQHSFYTSEDMSDGYDYEAYRDTYEDSSVAAKEVTSALEMVSNGLGNMEKSDSLVSNMPGIIK